MVCMNLISHRVTSLIVYQLTGPRFFKWTSLSIPYTSSIDTFHVQDIQGLRQYMITTSDRSGSVSLHKITRKGLRHSQTITIPGAKTTKNIHINNTVYIAVACNNNDNTKTDSQLYALTNDGTLKHVQTFNDNEADDITFGMTNNEIFLTLTTNNGRSQTGLPSKVYKWDPKHRLFNIIQSLETIYGVKPNFFNTKDHLWLSIACQYNTSSILNSFIYRWNGSRFEVFQTIPSPHATKDLHPVNTGTSLFLVATNFHGPLVVYKMNDFTGHFEIFQTISTSKVLALDSFTINSEHFIAVSSWEPSVGTSDTELIIYKFSGDSYSSFQEITTYHASSIKVFRDVLSGSWLMGIANVSKRSVDLYRWNDASNNC